MLKYGIYTRKSDDDRSITEKSIGEQLQECHRIAERDELKVVQIWEESRSAKHPHRRVGYKELISAIERNRIDGIVCWHVNRLVRNLEEGGKLAQLLIEGKIREIRTPSAVYRTGDNIMPLIIEAASATQFSLDLSKSVERGMNGSFRNGGCTHAAPQGYRNIRDPFNLKKGLIERDPDRFETVHRAWKLMLTGTSTLRRVVDTMNETWGFRTRPTKTRGNAKLSYTGAYLMFQNPFYAGFVRRKGELVKGRHEGMISSEEFERVQAILSVRSFSAPRVREFAYTGLMRCVHCGSQITAETKILRNGSLWENYHCSDAHLRCTKLGMSLKKVEARITEELESIQIEPQLLEIAEATIRRALYEDLNGIESLLASQEKALDQCNIRLEKLIEMWMNGLISEESRYRELEQRELAKKTRLLFESERIRGQAQRMQQNLERGVKYLSEAYQEFKMPVKRRRKEIASALATGYSFDGIRKSIGIQVHPLLSELAIFARNLARLEPPDSGSQNQKGPAFLKPVLFGGRYCSSIEPSSKLLEALQGPSFPDLWDESLAAGGNCHKLV